MNILPKLSALLLLAFLSGCDMQYADFNDLNDGCEAIEELETDTFTVISRDVGKPDTRVKWRRETSDECAVFYRSAEDRKSAKEEVGYMSFKKISKNLFIGLAVIGEEGRRGNDPIQKSFGYTSVHIVNRFDGHKYHFASKFPKELKVKIFDNVGEVIQKKSKTNVDYFAIADPIQALGIGLSIRQFIQSSEFGNGIKGHTLDEDGDGKLVEFVASNENQISNESKEPLLNTEKFEKPKSDREIDTSSSEYPDDNPLAKKSTPEISIKAINGDADYQFELGLRYYYAIGIEKDDTKAFDWWSKAADNDHGDAQANVSIAYLKGVAVKQNISKAFYYAILSAKNGSVKGQYTLGYLHLNGKGIDGKKPLDARELFIKSAKGGYQPAIDYLAKTGLKQDEYESALLWLKSEKEKLGKERYAKQGNVKRTNNGNSAQNKDSSFFEDCSSSNDKDLFTGCTARNQYKAVGTVAAGIAAIAVLGGIMSSDQTEPSTSEENNSKRREADKKRNNIFDELLAIQEFLK